MLYPVTSPWTHCIVSHTAKLITAAQRAQKSSDKNKKTESEPAFKQNPEMVYLLSVLCCIFTDCLCLCSLANPFFSYETPTCSAALHSLLLQHSSSLGHFSFEAPPLPPTSLPHQSIHHTESLEPPFTPSSSSAVALPSLFEGTASGQNLHSFSINLGLHRCC